MYVWQNTDITYIPSTTHAYTIQYTTLHYTVHLLISCTNALKACSYNPLTNAAKASAPWLDRGCDGDEVAVMSGMAPGTGELANNDDKRDPVPWGGEKMSLPRSSWLMPRS